MHSVVDVIGKGRAWDLLKLRVVNFTICMGYNNFFIYKNVYIRFLKNFRAL